MVVLDVLAEFLLLGHGVLRLIAEIRIFSRCQQDKLGADIKISGAIMSL
jgi:hypothetical protein